MRYEYSYSCECGDENGPYESRTDASTAARRHAIFDKRCGVKDPVVFIDQYDLEAGELSGSYVKTRIATPSKR